MGAQRGVHVSDPALHGADALVTARVLCSRRLRGSRANPPSSARVCQAWGDVSHLATARLGARLRHAWRRSGPRMEPDDVLHERARLSHALSGERTLRATGDLLYQ
jgi:hypothetical protein